MKNTSLLAICFLLCALGLPWTVCSAGFERVRLDEIRLGGELERRLMMTVTNNLLQAEIDHQFLDHFRTKALGGDSVGTGKLIECAVRFAVYTRDARVIALKNRLVDEILKTQDADGYIGCLRKGSRLWGYWDLAETGFLFLGLATDHRYFGSKRSLEAAKRGADYMMANWHTMPAGWEDAWISGIAASPGFAWGFEAIYRETGDTKYRDFAYKARHVDTWDEPITIGRGFGIRGHVATHFHQCLMQLLYRRDGCVTPHCATDETADFVLNRNGALVSGGAGLWECWTNDQDGRHALAETCTTTFQMWFWDALLQACERPDARWGDALERTLWNSFFGAQSETGRKIRYYTPIEGTRLYWNRDTYCCPNNFRRMMSEMPEQVFYKSDRGLYANIYMPATLKTKLADGTKVEVVERTEYPTEGRIDFVLTPEKPAEFTFFLRIPGWCDKPSLTVDGESVDVRPGTVAEVRRRWKPGAHVTLDLPLELKTVIGRRRQSGRLAFVRGPLLYSLNPVRNGALAPGEKRSHVITAEDQHRGDRGTFMAKDPADICVEMLVDPASAQVIPDETVRPNGTAVRLRASFIGHATGVMDNNSSEIVLTEFPDVGAMATYFRASDLSVAVPDVVFRGQE